MNNKSNTAIITMGISVAITAAALYKFKETKSPVVEIALPLVIAIGVIGISMSSIDYKNSKEKEAK